jgi:hypothetical protein
MHVATPLETLTRHRRELLNTITTLAKVGGEFERRDSSNAWGGH